jgi:molybdopterin-synthase adenylyltransferase
VSPEEIERYARHIVPREIGGAGQRRLGAARAVVVGAGGLGSPAILYLAAAGVGRIAVVDDDAVALSNLQRQVLHGMPEIGRPKVESAQAAVARLNPHVAVEAHALRLAAENAGALLAEADIVLDGCDSFATRAVVNAACVRAGVPLVSAAMSQWEGQVSLYHPASGGPCYACIFPEAPAVGLAPSCAEAGIVGALPGVMGSMMALEAIKWIARAGRSLLGRMLIYDALDAEVRTLRLARRRDCAVCGSPAG